MSLEVGAYASPPETGKARVPFRERAQQFSLRSANAFRNLYERIPPGVRHTGMALITSAATVASAHQLAGGDLTSVRGALGLTGVVLGSSTSLDQGRRALRAFFPDQMKKVSDRLKRSPIIGPWVRDSRPWWQRWRRRSKPDG